MDTGFHLPHNAVIPEEVQFIFGLLDIKRSYYLYDEIKALIFEEEIKHDVFRIYHNGMYKNLTTNPLWNTRYNKIKTGELKYNDIRNIDYTGKKTLNGCWNEIVRDYCEFFAFMGTLPSYYKGRATNEYEKRYYIGETLKKYRNKQITYSDLLFCMKFRNASKNYDNFEQYNVRNRPFVVALKVMNIFKKNGHNVIDGSTLSYYIKTTTDEKQLEDYSYITAMKPIVESDFTDNELRELSRGVTFLRQHLERGLNIKTVSSRKIQFDLRSFDITKYNFKNNSIFIGDIYDDIEVTPVLLRCLNDPNTIEDENLKIKLIELGLISKDGINSLYDYNVDTDLPDRNLVLQFNSTKTVATIPVSTNIQTTQVYKEGKAIAVSGDGTKYEEFLYSFLKNKFTNFNVYYLGANTVGQRLSDIMMDIDIINEDDSKSSIRIIIEAKSGSAIKSFDERKELDDITNTLSNQNYAKDYSGVWYMIVDSDQIPQSGGHGGYRGNSNQLSFQEKLLKIQNSILSKTCKPTLVTAFSYEKFMLFLDSIKLTSNINYLSKVQAHDFWTWSNHFYGTSFVTIKA